MSKPMIKESVDSKETDTPQRRVKAADLLQGGRVLLIQHNGDEYRLQLTKSDKLILTK